MIHHSHHEHNMSLVSLSVFIAIFASYVALDLASSINAARRKRIGILLVGGAVALGVGIWSMHFVGMLAFSLPGTEISYDIPLMLLSIIVSVSASFLAFLIINQPQTTHFTNMAGSLTMGFAIAGMHYIGIASMVMAADIHWDYTWVVLSVLIAVVASYIAIILAFKLRADTSGRGYLQRGLGAVVMGIAISGMHYTGMRAMDFTLTHMPVVAEGKLVATNTLAFLIILGTIIILGIAVWGSAIDRALNRRIQMNEILEEAVRSRDHFLSIASHELNTPLTAMKLQTQLMLRNISRAKSMSEHEIIQLNRTLLQTDKSIDRLTRLVNDMLDISRISTNKMTLQLEEFNLTDLVVDVTESLAPHIMEHKSRIYINKESNIIGAWDRFRIEQVVSNLLTNAGRYGNGKPIEVKVTQDHDMANIHVKDYGRGIAKEDQERIFQRFERAIPYYEVSGMGLGLFIVKEIVLMHGGSIRVESELNQGAEFIVSLPIRPTN